MFRGGAAVAMPTTTTTRPVGRLNLLPQQSGGVLQQTAGAGPVWRRAARGLDQPPPPPPPATNCELKQKWRAGLSHRVPLVSEEAPKPEVQSLPQWKRKQEQEKKPEEAERKVEPLWKRIREAEKKQESERKQEQEKSHKDEKQHLTGTNMERKRPEPLWKSKVEAERLEIKPEPEKKTDPLFKGKQEVTKNNEITNHQQNAKLELPKKQEFRKIEPVKKLEPLWKRKFEPVKKPEPEIKDAAPMKTLQPIWKRKTEPQEKHEPATKQETMKKAEPKLPAKVEPIWKRKIEPEGKQVATTKQEPVKKPEPLWKRKKEPEKEPVQKTDSTKKPDSLDKSKKDVEKKEKEEHSNEDQPEEDDAEELLCPMCSELFEEEEHPPVLLPRCGHVFCRPCLATIKGKGHFPCPTCRKRHLKPPIEELPIHNEILCRTNAYRDDKTGKCQSHQELLRYWCRDCQKPLCATCRVMNGHNLVRTKVVLQEKRQEMKERGQDILDHVLDEKRKIIDSVRTCSVQLMKVCEESVVVGDSSQDVKQMLADTKQTADLGFVIRSLQRMKSILGFFSKAASDSDSDDSTTPKLRRRRERRLAQQSGDADTNDVAKTSEKRASLNPAENKRDFQTKQENDVTGSMRLHKTADMRVTHQQAAAGGLHGVAAAEVMSQGPLLSLSDASLWPLTCCVYAENGRRARLARQGGRLHMSALTEDEEEAHFMIKLPVIQSVIPQEQPEVFLDIEAGERRLGRIYIKLWGHLRRAHHFLALCMGTHGPSYRGAKFEEVFSRGLKGECLHAGPYLTPAGDLSAQQVMDGLEWDGQFKGQQKKGMVVGAGSGRPDRESCFDICTIENPTRQFACPFGEVVGGWDTVMAILEYRPVRAVTMVDVGVVLPDGVLPVS